MVKKQGGGGRIHPNPFSDLVDHKVIVYILKEKTEENPPRVALQLKDQLKFKKEG
ncbi:hypothetical protein MmarC5_1123 [Methanococcus maripaludis C5]|uniref:Uncharacterized protein n=1 Tax=Methanococcus maripaludis (strain C5 / ATCC BAA-1333) TaxID=402880 RepID=A4FYZ0_METM5|nr:hypothetical protein [Methanococcus maripaludis]ABO35424.1 hypothetical protein MmarC5_1123 [Methanococcus maripaludis C5]